MTTADSISNNANARPGDVTRVNPQNLDPISTNPIMPATPPDPSRAGPEPK